jgi:hypothetical protein
MLLNIIILAFVLAGAAKKKINAYFTGLILAGCKAGIYLLFGSSVVDALIVGLLWGLLGFGISSLLTRLNKKPNPVEDPSKMYSSADKSKFQWEYVPLSIFTVTLILGELLLKILIQSP